MSAEGIAEASAGNSVFVSASAASANAGDDDGMSTVSPIDCSMPAVPIFGVVVADLLLLAKIDLLQRCCSIAARCFVFREYALYGNRAGIGSDLIH
jgi:hypothetical protein